MNTEAPDTPAKQTSSMMYEPEYNPETQTLTIRFKSGSGAVHQYDNFTQEEFDAFYSAPSWGRHFKDRIRPRYEGKSTRVNSPEVVKPS